MRLLLIGNGRWSEKIFESLEKGAPNVSCAVIGSRYFLQEFTPKSGIKADVVWVTSRPDSQQRILEHLSDFPGIVVLEKPIGRSIQDYEKVRESKLYRKGQLRFSRAWNYSETWLQLKETLKSSISRIEIIRGGPSHDSSIPLHEDWLPHDIFLLTDLFGHSMLKLDVNSSEIKNEFLTSEFVVANPQVSVSLAVGRIDTGRVAQWRIFQGKELLLSADFSNAKIVFANGQITEATSNQDAICRMISHLQNIEQNRIILDLDVQKLIAQEFLKIS